MTGKEVISIVIPVYNREKIVGRTLESVREQTYRPLHLVLVDNNSSDGTLRLLEAWKVANEREGFRITVVSETKPGAAAARNRGLREVTTGKLVFFDSDDEMGRDMIAAGMEVFHRNPDAEFVYWRHERECMGGGVRRSHFTTGDKMECHLVHALLNTSSYMVKTEYLRKIGGWDEDTRVWDDYELGVRMLLPSVKSVGIDRMLYTVKSQEMSITGTEFTSRAGEWEKALDKIERDIASSGCADRDRLLRIVDYRRIILAAHYAKEGSVEIAGKLKFTTLSGARLSCVRKIMLRFAYFYTRHGGRGAWLLLSRFI